MSAVRLFVYLIVYEFCYQGHLFTRKCVRKQFMSDREQFMRNSLTKIELQKLGIFTSLRDLFHVILQIDDANFLFHVLYVFDCNLPLTKTSQSFGDTGCDSNNTFKAIPFVNDNGDIIIEKWDGL